MVGNYLGQLCPGKASSSSEDEDEEGRARTNPSGDGGFSCVDSPLAAITAANTGGSVSFAQGCDIDGTDKSKFAAAIAAAKAADIVVLGLGIVQAIEAESHDRTEVDLPAIQHELAAEIAKLGKPTAIFLLHGGCAPFPSNHVLFSSSAGLKCSSPPRTAAVASSALLKAVWFRCVWVWMRLSVGLLVCW